MHHRVFTLVGRVPRSVYLILLVIVAVRWYLVRHLGRKAVGGPHHDIKLAPNGIHPTLRNRRDNQRIRPTFRGQGGTLSGLEFCGL